MIYGFLLTRGDDTMGKDTKQEQSPSIRYRLFRMVSVGVVDEPINQFYDIVSTAALIVNLIASILLTFDDVRESIGPILDAIEHGTVLFSLWTIFCG